MCSVATRVLKRKILVVQYLHLFKKFSSKSKMDSEEFDTDLFIDEIEKRPPIWNMSTSDYSNKIAKRKTWEEIFLIFCDPDETEERKKCLGNYY